MTGWLCNRMKCIGLRILEWLVDPLASGRGEQHKSVWNNPPGNRRGNCYDGSLNAARFMFSKIHVIALKSSYFRSLVSLMGEDYSGLKNSILPLNQFRRQDAPFIQSLFCFCFSLPLWFCFLRLCLCFLWLIQFDLLLWNPYQNSLLKLSLTFFSLYLFFWHPSWEHVYGRIITFLSLASGSNDFPSFGILNFRLLFLCSLYSSYPLCCLSLFNVIISLLCSS